MTILSFVKADGTEQEVYRGNYNENYTDGDYYDWISQEACVIDFGDEPQLVDSAFRQYFGANAKSVEETAPQKYSITYDLSGLSDVEILAQPTEIYEGQTVYFVFTKGNTFDSLVSTVTNCDYEGTTYTNYQSDTALTWPIVVALSNPTGDVTIRIDPPVGGGAN